MSLIDRVHVARRFQRSIRIDTDLHDPKALEGFICPESSSDVLLTMAQHVLEAGQGAFTWTGPYGSGKSSLVVALSAALNGNAALRAEAQATLGKDVVKPLWEAMPPKSKGWRILPIVGQRAAPAEIIGDALVANGYVRRRPDARWTDDEVISKLTTIANEQPRSHGGLVVFLDEMGKCLEGAAHDGTDIFLFQQLAEAATRSNGRLVFIGILHQAFEEYAQRLARDLRDEWAKIQGRFVDLMVNTVGDEQLELLARAIQNDRRAPLLRSTSEAVARTVRAERPSAAENLSETLDRCWPLHPIVACLLGPISRRRFGQNQRSLFGFLNSAEPFGFQEFLRDAGDGDLFGPERLWEYLRANLEPAILASPDGHRWSMAVEAIERCEAVGGEAIHITLLKTVALLELFRERSGLSATVALLATCVSESPPAAVRGALQQLQAWSLIIFRKHLTAYAIHAGSDFDIEQALGQALDSIRAINFRELKSLAGLQPILAKRHYHHTGTLRWFDVDLVALADVGERAKDDAPSNGGIGRFLLVIPTANESKPKATKICQEAVTEAVGDVVIGLSAASWQVMQLAREFLAITKVSEERPELSGDAIARREVLARIADIRARLEAELQKMFDTAEWYRPGLPPARHSYSELNAVASSIADERYAAAPRIANELLNRQKPSSNAVAAQKALLKLMVEREGEERLGIEGYPAEGGLFDSILMATGLYRPTMRGWRFLPPSKSDPCGLLPAWRAATDFLKDHAAAPVTMADFFAIWGRPPYGIKEGLLPIFGVAYLLAQRDRLAFYRDGVFQARFTYLDVEFLTTDPASIQIRWMDLSEMSRRMLSGLAAVVREFDGKNPLVLLEPVDVARGLVGIHDGLKPWVKRTNRLSANALQVRLLFKQATDPNKFLFDEIPALFGQIDADADIEAVITRVRDGLQELTQAYGDMLGRLQQMMLTELQVPNSSTQALGELRARAENVQNVTGDFRLDAFIGRLTQFAAAEADMEGIASLAVNKPSRDWVDPDLDQAGVEIADLAQKFVRAEAFARVKGRKDKRLAMAVMVGIDGRPTPLVREFSIRDSDREAVDDLVSRVGRALASGDQQNSNVILAALAETSARYLDKDESAAARPARSPRKAAAR